VYKASNSVPLKLQPDIENVTFIFVGANFARLVHVAKRDVVVVTAVQLNAGSSFNVEHPLNIEEIVTAFIILSRGTVVRL